MKFLMVCALLAPCTAIAAGTSNEKAAMQADTEVYNRFQSSQAAAVQQQELQTLRQISAEVAALRNDIRCIRIRASGGAC